MNTLAERFWAKVEVRDGCWGWTAYTNKDGYGRLCSGGKGGPMLYAHRVSWEIHNGPVPRGLFVLHTCDNPPCCNPAHLFLGTKDDNAKDMARKGRAWSPTGLRNKAATHCPHGHAYSDENTYATAGGRRCRTCVLARRQHYRAAHKTEIAARNRWAYAARTAGQPRKPNANAAKTHCKRGHAFTEANTLRYNGARYCRECHRIRARRRVRHSSPSRPRQRPRH